MVTNFKKYTRKDDITFLTRVILIFLFIVWLCTPPGNKFIQLCFWGNNTRLAIAKVTNNAETTEWLFHRNNAVYLMQMDNKKSALREINTAIRIVPTYISEDKVEQLYKDKALISIYFKEHKEALSEYVKLNKTDIYDDLRIAMLYKKNGHLKTAMSYCNDLLSKNSSMYAGYACAADVYGAAGRYDVSVRLLDMLVDKHPNRGSYYMERAYYKKAMGDLPAYNDDVGKAIELGVKTDKFELFTESLLNPKQIKLKII